jgi:hypothetical protein
VTVAQVRPQHAVLMVAELTAQTNKAGGKGADTRGLHRLPLVYDDDSWFSTAVGQGGSTPTPKNGESARTTL